MAEPVRIVLMWHMHQPYYKDPVRGEYALPWTYLHATKDYFDMGAIIEDVPGAKAVINVVPSLLEQLQEYAAGTAVDPFILRTKLSPAAMTTDDRLFILENFFSAHRERMIEPHRRYMELYYMAGEGKPGAASERLRHFDDQDILDLQVCFLLAWTGEAARRRFPECRALLEKDQGYSEEDRNTLLSIHQTILSSIIPLYRRLQAQGRIELTVSPYYHPILPLLCDTSIAKVAMPDVSVPQEPFQEPVDARAQVLQGVAYFKSVFGVAPDGMWPSEGAVSDEALSIIQSCGITWVATDEEILGQSLSGGLVGGQRRLLYQPWRFRDQAGGLGMLFRDHQLSDLIGFTYSGWDPVRAVADFIGKITQIAAQGGEVIPVILDGENAWEFYEQNGYAFLTHLYHELASNPAIRLTTGAAIFSKAGEDHRLTHVHPGSWINGNYGIWIGHPEENRGWEQIRLARQAMVAALPEINQALITGQLPEDPHARMLCTSLYAAQGSDWFWWYGDDHYCPHSDRFDRLFRLHLTNIYQLLSLPVPQALLEPIKVMSPAGLVRLPAAFIRPVVNGEIGGYFEWLAAGKYDLTKQGSSMHASERLMSALYWGYDENTLYLRLDCARPCDQFLSPGDVLYVDLVGEIEQRLVITPETGQGLLLNRADQGYHEQDVKLQVGVGGIVELGIPLLALKPAATGRWYLVLTLLSAEQLRGRWPSDGSIVLPYEGAALELNDWIV